MTTRVLRKIVRIDEEKCNGCGLCVSSCAEGALRIIDGKARLISEVYCDGLGACLGECPMEAITIEEREAQEFDEEAVEHHLQAKEQDAAAELSRSCPSVNVSRFERAAGAEVPAVAARPMLSNWPVQLTLVPPLRPFPAGSRPAADRRLRPLCLSRLSSGVVERPRPDYCLSQA